jgi:uncharacterized protein YndB with AHSA1/START domain
VVTAWEPPTRLVLDWCAVNSDPTEKTEVEVTFSPSGTWVSVVHRGWSRFRPDHPARDGLEVPAFVRMIGLNLSIPGELEPHMPAIAQWFAERPPKDA